MPHRDRPYGGAAPDADARWFPAVLHLCFYLLLLAALIRFTYRHEDSWKFGWVLGLCLALAFLYPLRPQARRGQVAWLLTMAALLTVLTQLAPSFAWCAIPLFYAGLQILPAPWAIALITVLTGLVVEAQVRLSEKIDVDLFIMPPAVAALATAVFLYMRRQAETERALQREIAAGERREGVLAERQRLSMEIHDTLAQGSSSLQMLLQAADRVWDTDPAAARDHVRTATDIAGRNLTEARRFVHDLAPADLAESGTLSGALSALADREPAGLVVRLHEDGTPPGPLPDRVQSALLRIAQGALANVREHAGATTARLTLTYLDDQVVLDVADDGRGFDPGAVHPGEERGHGLGAMRARVAQLGGTLNVESAPGEGTVVSASIPLEPR
ncbi:sensor histidine kinase [Streptomyces sp. NPDC051940]|uniref:sensor histidine kinase n=1 Tax=Streptomyces sp. NPDC051940 TaxID=3155675 RepID=UPI003428178A